MKHKQLRLPVACAYAVFSRAISRQRNLPSPYIFLSEGERIAPDLSSRCPGRQPARKSFNRMLANALAEMFSPALFVRILEVDAKCNGACQ